MTGAVVGLDGQPLHREAHEPRIIFRNACASQLRRMLMCCKTQQDDCRNPFACFCARPRRYHLTSATVRIRIARGPAYRAFETY